ncbi:mitochondrial calcium uniporter regulator 1 [Amia ocellicauda]|uniref:mitochondrial calcium uniporter regulator 1 n=1 Tax=Amia ocellicauda TaxID=2972642 RepID=UPI003464BE3A
MKEIRGIMLLKAYWRGTCHAMKTYSAKHIKSSHGQHRSLAAGACGPSSWPSRGRSGFVAAGDPVQLSGACATCWGDQTVTDEEEDGVSGAGDGEILRRRHRAGSGCATDSRRKSLRNKTDIFTGIEAAFSLKRPHALLRELSTSVISRQYDLKNMEAPKSERRNLYFDTHAMVRLFEDNGFSTEQAEVIVSALAKITNSNMDVIYKDMVTKVQQEIMLQRVMSNIVAVKKDMVILEKSEFSALRAENEKVKTELEQLKMQLADEISKVRADTILDMNLEKSWVKETYAEHERKLLEAKTEIVEMHAEEDRSVTQTNMKINTEVSGLKTMLESHKLDTIKYLAGSVFTCLTIALGFYRIWM